MEKKLHFYAMVVLLLMAIPAFSTPISKHAALKRAVAFMKGKGREAKMVYADMHQAGIQKTTPFYVFNAENNNGFVIVSGDDNSEEIIGYSLTGNLTNGIPKSLQVMLDAYAEVGVSVNAGAYTSGSREAVYPLITTKWDQDAPYNGLCPEIGGERCVTGCVATAMAQVMKYHEWPTEATTQIPGYVASNLSLSTLPPVMFDWESMKNNYVGSATQAEQDAVATLMEYCGYGSEMDFSIDESGTNIDAAAKAFRSYFGYDTGTRIETREAYSAAAWDNLIYGELIANRPVLYAGTSAGGAHAFVCDGYDGNGFYHINWGWGGHGDGYYQLSILAPNATGTGGSTSEGGYSMKQSAIVGIQPPQLNSEDLRTLTLYDNLYTSGNLLYGEFWNRSGEEGTFDYGFAVLNERTSDVTVFGTTQHFDIGEVRRVYADVSSLGLANGTYRFYPISRLSTLSWWQPVYETSITYVTATITGSNVSFDYHPSSELTVGVSFAGNKMATSTQEVKVSINNASDEFNNTFYLFASKTTSMGTVVDKTGVVVPAEGSAEASLYFTPNSAGTWNVWLALDEEGTVAVGPFSVTIGNASTSAATLSMTDYSIEPYSMVTIQTEVKNNGSVAYYRDVLAALYDSDYNLVDYSSTGDLSLDTGGSAAYSFHFEGLEVGRTYEFVLWYQPVFNNSNIAQMTNPYSFIVQEGRPGDEIVVTVNDATREYGDTNPSFSYTVSGGTLVGKPTFTCDASRQSSVGNYPIVANKGTVKLSNVRFVNGTLAITPAPLMIGTGDYAIHQGEPLPVFTPIYSGFKNSDNESMLTALPVITTTATAASAPGIYPLTVSGADAENYAISYTNGQLEILPTTKINATINTEAQSFDVYSVDGKLLRRQATTLRDLPRGIYLVNGKKVVITQ